MVDPEGIATFPADDARHDEPLEWWYWIGHVKTSAGRWFGLHWIFLADKMQDMDYQVVVYAVTDLDAGEMRQTSNMIFSKLQKNAENSFDLALGSQTAKGTSAEHSLHGELDPNNTIDLQATATTPPAYVFNDGYWKFDTGDYWNMYHRPGLAVTGTLSWDGQIFQVEGAAWLEHQWGDGDNVMKAGWDSFNIELETGEHIMLYTINDPGANLKGGYIVDKACAFSRLLPDQFEVTPLGTWTSPKSNITYPLGWKAVVNGREFEINPYFADQEIVIDIGPSYWEGMSVVSGDAAGRAHTELYGYKPNK